jgi:anti-anti-sigma regulatory factor
LLRLRYVLSRCATPQTSIWDFQSLVRGGSGQTTIVDLTEVLYMDSVAPGSLVGLHVSCQRLQRKYALAGAGQRLTTLFTVAGSSEF